MARTVGGSPNAAGEMHPILAHLDRKPGGAEAHAMAAQYVANVMKRAMEEYELHGHEANPDWDDIACMDRLADLAILGLLVETGAEARGLSDHGKTQGR